MRSLNRSRMKGTATFCYVWLTLGFFTGTLVLLGPVRWTTNVLRSRGFAQRTEDLAIDGIIALYVGASALLAWWLVRRMSSCGARVRIGVPSALTVAAAVCLWGWLNPAHLLGAAAVDDNATVTASGGVQFVFGAYPDRDRLVQLKQEGFAGVVSLQHPAVLPFEPIGIADEQKAAREIGLEFVHAPMLPWISDNSQALDVIRHLAATGHGKYYVHCGLGRDRTNVVRHMLEGEGARVASARDAVAPGGMDVEGDTQWERGDIRQVESKIWLIPYPNEHEVFGRLLAGQMAHVTLALDPDDPNQQAWTDTMTNLFTQYGIAFDERPLRRGDTATARAIADAARRGPKPAAIIVGYTDPFPKFTEPAHALLTSFAAGEQHGSTHSQRE